MDITATKQAGVYHLNLDGKGVWLFQREVMELIDNLNNLVNNG